ncbi:SDR family oxidoreductase [Actinocrinis sp.]|uniref:SDR family oxidoreductase n=1 Tax=Actinocrinis sp. TaxID=1920516 RepID=UPI002BDE120B|nr:SDR family oxidoreductase [Actinocrinis sp.]HXR72135.1 SDR family oxidoreductase [Actinocrinis sp.]
MRVFVTGASGFIGSAVIPELIKAGHEVVGLARSDAAAAAVEATGARVLRGSLEDLDVLRAGSEAADGVIHLGFIHDFNNFAHSVKVDRAAIEAIGSTLAGSDRAFITASGLIGALPGRVMTERDEFDSVTATSPRLANIQAAVAFADRGVRTAAVRFAPTVHGEGDHGFIKRLVEIAREKGASGYVGDGSNHWPAVHRFDAADLVRRALEKAPAGSQLHATAEQGVPIRDVAEVIGRHLNLPLVSIAPQDAAEHFGWLGAFIGADTQASSELTRELLDWQPTHPGLIDDLEKGHYFRTEAA